MKQTRFGDTIIESTDDDLSAFVDLEGAYAIVKEDSDTGKFMFEILDNEDGENRATSEPIFKDAEAVDDYLFKWLQPSEIQLQE